MPPEDKKKPAVRDVPKEELHIAYEGPAVFVNKFYVTGLGANVRIAFAENSKDLPPIFRTAVIMSTADVIRLRRVLEHAEMMLTKVDPPAEDA